MLATDQLRAYQLLSFADAGELAARCDLNSEAAFDVTQKASVAACNAAALCSASCTIEPIHLVSREGVPVCALGIVLRFTM